MMTMNLKKCHLCQEEKALDMFHSKRKECKECSKGVKLAYRYGITQAEYNEQLEIQGGVCSICQKSPEEVGKLAQDHDHSCCPGQRSCGKCLRELLCSRCNTSLGSIGDSISTALSMVTYLIKYS